MNCTLIHWWRILGKHWTFSQLLGRHRGIMKYITGLCGLVMTTTQDGEQKCRGAIQVVKHLENMLGDPRWILKITGNPRWILKITESVRLLLYCCKFWALLSGNSFVAVSFRTYWELYLSYYGSLGSFV